jgi:hypothetical protein
VLWRKPLHAMTDAFTTAGFRLAIISEPLAIWEGERPSDDAIAGIVYEAHMDVLELNDEPPTPRIRAYVEALLARWPELGEADDVPWAMSPLMDQASGPIAYLNLVYSMADEASVFAAKLAQEHGLACYDPQTECLRP